MYKRGFTLVEILFVVIIAAGLLALAVPSYKKAQERSEYMRAVGYLTSIGSAIVTLQRDYTMLSPDTYSSSTATGSTSKGAVYWNFPANSNLYYEFVNSPSLNTLNKAPTDYLYGVRNSAAATKDTYSIDALYGGGYLKSFTNNTQYKLYGVRHYKNNSTTYKSSICTSLCLNGTGGSATDPNKVVACMCKSTYDVNDCYYGAKYLLDGTVVRLRGADCKG